MNILMLAPEPFFQPRGTPISIYFRIRALADLGHNIDLVTYHLGENKTIKNLKILRIPDLFFIKKIKIGPSLAKIPLDFLLLLRAMFQLTKKPYDLIYSHEEAGFLGLHSGKSGKFRMFTTCIQASLSSWTTSSLLNPASSKDFFSG